MSEIFRTSNNQEKRKFEKKIILNQKNEVLLDVPADIPDLKMVESFATAHGLSVKDEFHVTLVGRETGQRITEASLENGQLREQIQELFKDVDWETIFKPTFYYLRREYNDPDPLDPQKTIPEIRETIIQLVDVPNLQKFHDDLRKLLGTEKPIVALPHVTIFSNSSRDDMKQRGIGIYSANDLAISNAKEIELN